MLVDAGKRLEDVVVFPRKPPAGGGHRLDDFGHGLADVPLLQELRRADAKLPRVLDVARDLRERGHRVLARRPPADRVERIEEDDADRRLVLGDEAVEQRLQDVLARAVAEDLGEARADAPVRLRRQPLEDRLEGGFVLRRAKRDDDVALESAAILDGGFDLLRLPFGLGPGVVRAGALAGLVVHAPRRRIHLAQQLFLVLPEVVDVVGHVDVAPDERLDGVGVVGLLKFADLQDDGAEVAVLAALDELLAELFEVALKQGEAEGGGEHGGIIREAAGSRQ